MLNRTIDALQASAGDFCVHYAVKANPNERIVREIASRGLGADCVSGAEVVRAAECGVPAEKIVFAGVGKTDAEIIRALELNIGCFNVESIEELEVISQLASARNLTANVALRVNPNVDAHTHRLITTGLEENKFGIHIKQLPEAMKRVGELPAIRLVGFHFHIGSQMLDYEPIVELCSVINILNERYEVQSINVGGGLGVDYEKPDENPVPDFAGFFNAYRSNLKLRPGQTVHFELGRSIVCQCGSLISRVTYVKHGINRNFVVVDAGMSELLRPALYGAHHLIQNLTSTGRVEPYDVVGPICESSDVFGTDELLPSTRRGDLIAFRSAGAYGEAMSSNYNLRSLNPPIFS